jgi:hypothetical protein
MRILNVAWCVCIALLMGCAVDTPDANRAEPQPAGSSAAVETQAPAQPAESEPNPTAVAQESAPAAAGESGQEKPAAGQVTGDSQLSLDRLVLAIPKGWDRKQASSTFVMAEFMLPRAESDAADGRLTVSAAGGSIEDNIQRWRDQFGGKPEQSAQERMDVDGMQVVIVELGGEFNDQRGPFAPATRRPGYRMLAAILPVGDELYFIKATGPQATIAAHADRIREFIASARKKT